MSATFDATTTAEYAAATTAAARSAVIVAALTGTISVKVFDGSNVEKGSGTMAAPWATASGDTVTIGEVSSFTVGATGTPDANWYIRFQNAGATRWVRGSFGLAGSGQDFTWSLSTWTAAQTGTIGTATIITVGNAAPAFTVAPTSASIASTGGTIQFTAVDPEGSSVTYSLTTTRSGITIDASTGLVTVTAAAAATSGTIVVQASDGTLTASASCYVSVSDASSDSSTPDYVDPVASVTLLGGRTTVNVSTAGELTTALADAVDGQTIQLAAGTYAGNFALTKTCAANNPIIVKGAANFGSIATGTWTMTGARQIVTGIDFNGAGAKISLQGTNNKVIGNKFRNWTTAGVITTNGTTGYHEMEIAYNEIGPPGSPASATYRWGIKGFSNSLESSVSKRLWIHHNWFRDYNSGYEGVDTRGDAIEAGESGSVSWANTLVAGWYIEDNVITNAQLAGDALFDVKYGGCVIRRNTVDSASSAVKIQARFGASSVLESNYMASGVIQSSGRGHKLVGNYGQVRVLAGEDEWDVVTSNLHHRSYQVLVAKNVGTLRVGHVVGTSYTLPALDTTIEEHTGGITLSLETGTIDNRNSPSSYQCAAAVQKTSADAGPTAISAASSSYKAARGL